MNSPAHRTLSGFDAIREWQEELDADLHENSVLSMRETRTGAAVARHLESFGYDVGAGSAAGWSVLANGPGPTVLFRADMDALPVTETTGLPYASRTTAVDANGDTLATGTEAAVVAALAWLTDR